MAKEHCCETMASYINPNCEQHSNPVDCEDALATYDAKTDSYALLARFWSSWVTQINFCPWCGDAMRDLSDKRYAELEALGFDEPLEQDIPEDFKSDLWWRKRGF